MKYKAIYLIAFYFFTTYSVMGQTRLISHKSHSGNSKNFKLTLNDISRSNFGMLFRPEVEDARLDSLIFLTDTSAIMATSRVEKPNKWKPIKELEYWKPGKDTVYHHKYFCLQHDLDSIKKVLDNDYNFQNKSKEISFIGYDNLQLKRKKKRKKKKKKNTQIKITTDSLSINKRKVFAYEENENYIAIPFGSNKPNQMSLIYPCLFIGCIILFLGYIHKKINLSFQV